MWPLWSHRAWEPPYKQKTRELVSGKTVWRSARLMYVRHRVEQRWGIGLKMIIPRSSPMVFQSSTDNVPRWGRKREKDHTQTNGDQNCNQTSTRNARRWKKLEKAFKLLRKFLIWNSLHSCTINKNKRNTDIFRHMKMQKMYCPCIPF